MIRTACQEMIMYSKHYNGVRLVVKDVKRSMLMLRSPAIFFLFIDKNN